MPEPWRIPCVWLDGMPYLDSLALEKCIRDEADEAEARATPEGQIHALILRAVADTIGNAKGEERRQRGTLLLGAEG